MKCQRLGAMLDKIMKGHRWYGDLAGRWSAINRSCHENCVFPGWYWNILWRDIGACMWFEHLFCQSSVTYYRLNPLGLATIPMCHETVSLIEMWSETRILVNGSRGTRWLWIIPMQFQRCPKDLRRLPTSLLVRSRSSAPIIQSIGGHEAENPIS
jgi:hypothetical protein